MPMLRISPSGNATTRWTSENVPDNNEMKYSIFSLAKAALSGHKGWGRAWRDPEPKKQYDVVIIGGGGHGLATAYFLAREYGIRNVAVLEKGWIGSGNAGRNTTIIRSNYMLPGNIGFYELSMKLWESMEQDLNYNTMVSQRGIINLYHSDAQRDAFARRGNAMRINGIDAELLDAVQVRKMLPFLNYDNARFPIQGGLLQRRAGTARHDAVVWGYARAADLSWRRHHPELRSHRLHPRGNGTDHRRRNVARRDRRGQSRHGGGGLESRASPRWPALRLPIESHVLQAFVSEAIKPLIPGVITFGAGHFYVSQSDKGGLVFGGDLDGYNSYAQRGNMPVMEDVCEGGMALMPMIGRVRLLRQWGGIMDMSMDGTPIIDRTPGRRPLHQCGLVLWRLQGDARPRAWSLPIFWRATNRIEEASRFRLDRFRRGAMIDEKGQGAQPNLH